MFRFGVLAIVTFALVAAACSNGETTIVDSSQAPEGITVTGEGSVFGAPDVALLTLGVEANAVTVSDARAQASESMDAVRATLTAEGVADEDLQTSRFSIQPRYSPTSQQAEIVGFTVSNIATVKIRDIDRTGELIDAAVTAGGDRARVEGLTFTIDDPTALEDQAREEAMAKAKAKAETLAEAGGIGLGAPRSISEGGGAIPVTFDAERFQAADAATSIDAGQLEVQISVTVVYEVD